MAKVLVTWVGQTDLNAAADDDQQEIGPVGQAVTGRKFDHVVLFTNYGKGKTAPFVSWIEQKCDASVELRLAELSSPINIGEIYTFVTDQIADLLKEHGDATQLTYHLSPGTPAMQAVWIIVAKTRHAATLIQASREQGLQTRMLLQVHDELVFEVPEAAQQALGARVRELMEGVLPLRVPLVVDVGVGRNWREAH